MQSWPPANLRNMGREPDGAGRRSRCSRSTPQPRFDGRVDTAVHHRTSDQTSKDARGRIHAEISPNGIPRDVIRELADAGGAYIIVSSLDSTAHRSLLDRRTAMREAVAGIPNSAALAMDFFDCGRWYRASKSIVVATSTGTAIPGSNRAGTRIL